MNKTRILLLLIIGSFAAYIGLGCYNELSIVQLLGEGQPSDSSPVVYNDINFNSAHDMMIYIADSRRNALFPWAVELDGVIAAIFLASACGCLGGMLRDFYDMKGAENNLLPNWILGVLLGPLILGVMILFPTVMTEGEWRLRLEAVVIAPALGALFSNSALAYLQKASGKIFNDN